MNIGRDIFFEGEHFRSFSYDLGWSCYCAGWRQSRLLEELSLIRICLLEDHLKNCILSLLRCRACDLHTQFRWAARFFTMFWKKNTKIFCPSCTPRVRECLCCYQTDSQQHGSPPSASGQWTDIALMVWAVSSGRTLAVGVSSPSLTVHFVCPSEHRLLTNCGYGSTI